ncbi:MAG: hypothetical protein AAFR20_07970 [Pseudomonadota bacterium]
MDSIFLWRLCETLTIPQAALLMIGYDPENLEWDVEGNPFKNRPEGYGPCRASLVSALIEEKIKGKIRYSTDEYAENPEIDVSESRVDVASLKEWLLEKGFHDHFFFFPDGVESEFLDPEHPRYAPKLAAAVTAWRALDDPEKQTAKTPKQAISKWLREHASRFGLSNEDGKPNEYAIEEVAKIANWQPKGGAPTTPSSSSATKQNEKAALLSITRPKLLPKPEQSTYELPDDIPF